MPEFILDTSGTVDGTAFPEDFPDRAQWTLDVRWNHLDSFMQGYVTALFWTSCEPGTVQEAEDDFSRVWEPENDSSLPGDVVFSDLAPEALASIIEDCRRFQAEAADLIEQAGERGYSEERAGHDFWLTRNGHGAGFWDREELEPEGEEWESTRIPLDQWTPETRATLERLRAESLGQRLTKIAKGFGEADAYLGDDGKVYV